MGRKKHSDNLNNELDCEILTHRLLNILVYNKNLIISNDRYENSIKLICKKYFGCSYGDNRMTEDKKLLIAHQADKKWHELIKKYAGFDVSIRRSVFPNLSHILILEKE